MGRKDSIPDAWEDDDWESQADRAAQQEKARAHAGTTAAPPPEEPLTRTERLARHSETQRKIWEAA